MTEKIIGKKEWYVADGFMSDTKKGGYVSHEAVCVLNLSGETANICITIYFEDREPMEGIRAVCEDKRANHIRLDKAVDEKGNMIPKNTPYAIGIVSDRPIVVQCSRLDVSQPEYTLMTTMAY